MSEDQSLNEFKKLVQYIAEAETNDFFELAKILGRNPKTDYAGANLNEVNLSYGDLQGANLRKTNLSSTDLTRADLSGADLSYADLSCANLTETNLSETNLSGARLEYARFRNNQGLSEAMKLDLSKRGAIFENSDSETENDINCEAFKKERKKWLEIYKGEYVALVDGQLVDHDKNKKNLTARLNLEYSDKPKFIQQVDYVDYKEEKITDVPIHWN